MTAPHRLVPLAAAAVVLTLAGCGGGGDDEPAASPPPAGSPSTVAGATCSIADFEANVMARVNQWRARGATCGEHGSFGPAPAMSWDERLVTAAANHSRDMAAANFFSHTGSGGSNVGQRVTAAGYAWSTVGENIAAGYTSVATVVDGWMASPGHCANLMNPAFQHVGVACVPGSAATTYQTYWTMDLARPR